MMEHVDSDVLRADSQDMGGKAASVTAMASSKEGYFPTSVTTI
jgi:hypothetical protein